MRKLWAGTVAVIALAAALAATSQAVTAVASGDTCVANGNGTSYTLTVSLGAGSPQQDGFAVGVKGGTVTRLTIGGVPGTASTSGLPAGTDQAWLLGSPQGVAGASIALAVTTMGAAKTFTVVPWDQEHQQWFDAVPCPVSSLGVPVGSAFKVANSFAYKAPSHGWTFSVTVPSPGTINVSQAGGSRLLIAQRRTNIGHAGTVHMMVGTTAAGRSALAKSGALKVRLAVEFSPASGSKPTTKTMAVTLTTTM